MSDGRRFTVTLEPRLDRITRTASVVLASDYDSLRQQLAEAKAENARLKMKKYQAVVVQENEHCKDCCCAQSWKALGIDTYTGKSIPEHITELHAELTACRADREAMRATLEIARGYIPDDDHTARDDLEVVCAALAKDSK